MGYSTQFEGVLYFTNPPSAAQLTVLQSMFDDYDLRIDLEITRDGVGLEWNGAEKTYEMVESVNYILETMQKEWPDFGLRGELLAQGEDIHDRWRLKIVNGRAVSVALNEQAANDVLVVEVGEPGGCPFREYDDMCELWACTLLDDGESQLPCIDIDLFPLRCPLRGDVRITVGKHV